MLSVSGDDRKAARNERRAGSGRERESWSLQLDFKANMASLPDGTCPRDLLHGLVAGTSSLVCADLIRQIILYTRALRCIILFSPGQKNYHSSLHWDCILFFVEGNQGERPVQRKLQCVKNNERSHKRTRATWHTKCRARGQCHSFSPLLLGSRIGVVPSYQGEPYNKT